MLKSTIKKFESFNVIDLYKQGYSLNQLETLVRSDKRTIRNYLLAKGVDVKINTDNIVIPNVEDLSKNSSDLRFDCHKFDLIDTEEKAYWLGFFYADGCITDNNVFRMSLQAQDVGHLHKLNRFLECTTNRVYYNPKITPEKTYDTYGFSIGNKILSDALREKGVIPRKSLILTFPDEAIFSKPCLVRHFIRGYWDGDGCISSISGHICVLGTMLFLEEFKKYVPALANANIYPHKNVFMYSLSKRQAVPVIKYLYENANIYLDRKYKEYLRFCRLYEESYKELEGKNDELWDENIVLTDEIS